MTDNWKTIILILLAILFLEVGFIAYVAVSTPHREHVCIERRCPSNQYSNLNQVCYPVSCTIPNNSAIFNENFSVYADPCRVETIIIDDKYFISYYDKSCRKDQR